MSSLVDYKALKGTITAVAKHNLLPIWIENISNNLLTIKSGKDISEIPESRKPALIIGAGPSLKRHNHLELLKKNEFNGIIFATDRILKDCLNSGIIPDYVAIMDASPKIFNYINHKIVDKFADKTTAIMAVQTHPSVVKRWKGDIFWYNTSIDETIIPNLNYIMYLLTKKTELPTAGHTSSLAWNAAFFVFKSNPIVIIGMDLSYPLDTPIEETWYYEGYLKRYNNDKNKVRSLYKKYHHSVFNTDCYYDPVFGYYITDSLFQLTEFAKTGRKIYNCTEGGAIEGEGINCMSLKKYLESQKP